MSQSEAARVFSVEPWMRLQDLPPPMSFPDKGLPEEEVEKAVRHQLANDVLPEKNFLTYSLDSHPFSKKIFSMALHTHQEGTVKDLYPGTHQMAQETVRMIGSLLGADDPAGFLTPGGTESNLCAVRLARNLAKKRAPELVMTETGHYSFRLAGELFGVRVKVAPVKPDLSPMMREVEGLINENTIMLISSAPEASLGVIDPVKEFGELAQKHGLYLHVDAAVGGFILPFMRDLGYNVPPFDFRVPQVSSMIADPHKLGMQQKPTSSFIFRDRAYLKAIPVEETLIPYLSGTSRMGASAASLWALIHYLGTDGYKRHVKNAMDLTNLIVNRIGEIGGLELVRQPTISLLGLISKEYDIRKVEMKVAAKGWVTPIWTLLHTQKPYLRIFVHPLKTREIVESYLEDLEMAVNAVKSEPGRP